MTQHRSSASPVSAAGGRASLLRVRPGTSYLHARPRLRISDDRIDYLLQLWADWQQNHVSDYGRGYPSRSSVCGISHATSFDDMVAESDRRIARAVDAVITSLPPVQRAAIHHMHLHAVYRFPRLGRGFEIAYSAAFEALRRGLQRRGIE